ncbi:MAG: hypothetical protein AAGD38_18600, partial [Acidobacteriota bacterium]
MPSSSWLRCRRWLIRPCSWLLVIGAALVLVAVIVLDSHQVRAALATELETQLSAVLGATATIERVDFSILPLEVEIWGLDIHGDEALGIPPFARIPYVLVDAELSALARRELRLQRLRIERPEFDITFFDDVDNVPGWRLDTEDLILVVERLEIVDARVVVDDRRIAWSASADALRTQLHAPDAQRLTGNLAAQNLTLRLPDARPIEVDVTTDMTLDETGLALDATRVTRPGEVALDVDAHCVWWLEPRCDADVVGEITGASLRRLGYFDDLDGTIDVEGTLVVRPDRAGWRGQVRAATIDILGERWTAVEGVSFADREHARVEIERAQWVNGIVAGSVAWPLEPESTRPVEIDLALTDGRAELLLARLMTHADPARFDDPDAASELDLASRVDGRLTYSFPMDEPAEGVGEGELQLWPTEDDASLVDLDDDGSIRLEGSVPFRLDRGWVETHTARLASDTQGVLVDGRWHLFESRGQVRWEIATSDLGVITAHVPMQDLAETTWLPRTGGGRMDGSLTVEGDRHVVETSFALDDVQTSVMGVARLEGKVRWRGRADGEGLIEHLDLRAANDDGGRLTVVGQLPTGWSQDPIGTDLMFTMKRWPAADARPWLEVPLPLDGLVDGVLEVTRDRAGDRGQIDAVIDDVEIDLGVSGVLAGDRLRTRLDWANGIMRVRDATLALPAGEITLGGAIDFGARRLALAWTGDDL